MDGGQRRRRRAVDPKVETLEPTDDIWWFLPKAHPTTTSGWRQRRRFNKLKGPTKHRNDDRRRRTFPENPCHELYSLHSLSESADFQFPGSHRTHYIWSGVSDSQQPSCSSSLLSKDAELCMPLPCSCFLSWSTIILLLLFPNVNTEHILGIPIQGGTAREGFFISLCSPPFLLSDTQTNNKSSTPRAFTRSFRPWQSSSTR